ncbi:MAG TPA: tetratricopeptide repeat protein [Geminicoccaceae bacterium]|nr:tetratricopeptide repeat protein [Geminicoccaceae bacterium]
MARRNGLARALPPGGAAAKGDDDRHRALGHLIEARRLLEAGDAAGAERACRRALRLRPDEPSALNFQGVALGRLGRTAEAERCARRAVALRPDDPGCHANLANRLKESGRIEAALEGYRRALALDPDHAPALRNLARTLAETGRPAEALAPARRLAGLEPDDPSGWALLAELLARRHRYDEAIAAYHRALELDPDRPDRWLNLARMGLFGLRLDEVERAAGRVLAAAPGHAEATVLLANALYRRGILGRTRELLETVPPVGLHGANALNLLGIVLVRQARVEEGLAAFERVGALAPDAIELNMNRLLHANYDPERSPEALRRAHEAWAERFAAPLAPAALPRITGARDPERPLRIGYLSPDFRRHSVAHFMAPLLHAHDRANFEAYCYAAVQREDSVTDELRARADGWRDVRLMGDAETAELIRADGIDILVELAGHTQDSRLPVCARKPAPVQIDYIGYPNTTGMAAMDYRLTDHWADPEGFDAHYVETLIRLPRCFLCYGLPADAPEIGPPPMLRNGHVTFGSFNNLAKVNRRVVALWARVLARVPGSRLLIKASGTGDPETRDNVHARFRDAGVEPGRVEIVPYTATPAEHLAVYDEVDVALDTFPYNGTTTTCEALWMGVPVITLAGDRHAARVGVSLLGAVGFTAGIARTPEEYELTAALLAGQPDLLAAARRALRADMRRSPLCQARDHAAAVEEAYRAVWRLRCEAR